MIARAQVDLRVFSGNDVYCLSGLEAEVPLGDAGVQVQLGEVEGVVERGQVPQGEVRLKQKSHLVKQKAFVHIEVLLGEEIVDILAVSAAE